MVGHDKGNGGANLVSLAPNVAVRDYPAAFFNAAGHEP